MMGGDAFERESRGTVRHENREGLPASPFRTSAASNNKYCIWRP